jgi:hypothetical protein
MNRPLAFATLLSMSNIAIAGNFATCILDEMPGIQNDPAAYAVYRMCVAKFPKIMNEVVQGSGRGFFSYKNGAECAAKLAGKTQSRQAGTFIVVACNKLYNEPNPFDPFDAAK